KPRIAIFAYLKNLKAPSQTHFLKHYPVIVWLIDCYWLFVTSGGRVVAGSNPVTPTEEKA
ncbi:hypothetical protein, partial [uncultured Alistipes sp.]|uniref:hypothetical protein n=1 Tax=uncultured Alistipes sp. TaxID=538949 RepID=UPI0025D587AD